MQEQVSRTLARARSATASGLQKRATPVAPVLEQLVAAMTRLPGSERVSWRVEAPGDALYPASEGELLEMLGNLVDNARKWARGGVAIGVVARAGAGAITVEDDGPGMAAVEIAAIDRGRRWDEATPGTGFGLAITRDLAASTGGRLRLSDGPPGGLRATIEWANA